ncbi:MAG: lipopolysaccharide biosynthesis protein [Bacteroidota bacterium]
MEISLKSQIKSGLFYSALAKYSGIVISLVVSAVLSRLLTPEDFGVVAISMVFIVFISLLSDLGFAPAIIQNKNLTTDDTNNIFSFTIWTALLGSIIFFFCSGLISNFYHNKPLIVICKILSVNVFFSTCNIVPNALLMKDKKFKYIAVRTLTIQIIAGIISIIAAFEGASFYALLINPLLTSFVMFIIDYNKTGVNFKFKFDLSSVKKILSFSSYQLLFNIVNYFTRNADTLLIGRYLGINPLGYYDKSYRLMMLPVANITNVLTPIIHPIFSDMQNDKKRMYKANQKIVRLFAYIGFPFSVLLFFLSKEIILIVFGDQWIKAIPVFRILSLSTCLQIIGSSSGSFFQSLNAARYLFICGIVNASIVVSSLLFGLFYLKSIEGVALSFAIASLLGFYSTFYFLITKSFDESLLSFFKTLISPFAFALCLFVCLWCADLVIKPLSIYITAFVKVLIALVVSLIYVQLVERLGLKDLYKLLAKN